MTAPRMVLYQLVRHAAHYLYDHPDRGHDLEQWVIAAPDQPTHAQAVALGVAADATFHSGHAAGGEQCWMYLARRPMSAGTCERCATSAQKARAL